MNWLTVLYTIAVSFDQPVVRNREARRLLLLPSNGGLKIPEGKTNRRNNLKKSNARRNSANVKYVYGQKR